MVFLPKIFFQGFQVVFIPAMGTADFDGVNQYSIQLHFQFHILDLKHMKEVLPTTPPAFILIDALIIQNNNAFTPDFVFPVSKLALENRRVKQRADGGGQNSRTTNAGHILATVFRNILKRFTNRSGVGMYCLHPSCYPASSLSRKRASTVAYCQLCCPLFRSPTF